MSSSDSKHAAYKESKHHSDSTHVDCARLIGGTVSCLHVKRRIALSDAALTSAYVKRGILCVDIKIELAGRALVASGKVAGVWVAECRRCLDSIEGDFSTSFHEMFQEHHEEEHHKYLQRKYTAKHQSGKHQSCERLHPYEQEVYDLDSQQQDTDIWPVRQNLINLAPPARQCALLALPVAPLCSPDCVGPAPDCYPTYSVRDQQLHKKTNSRWAALNLLRFDD